MDDWLDYFGCDNMASVKNWFDVWAEKYDEYLPHFPVYQKIVKIIVDNANIEDGAKVLDVGIGTGNVCFSVFSRVPCDIVGVDVSSEMIKIAKKKADDIGANVSFLNSSADAMEIGNGFDFAVSAFALHHLRADGKVAAFRRIHSALKDGGRFVLADVTVDVDGDIGSEKRLKHLLERWGYEAQYALKYIGPDAVSIALGGLKGVYYRDGEYVETPGKLKSMLKEAGFKIVKHDVPDENIGYQVFVCDKR